MSLQLQALLKLKMGWAAPTGPSHPIVLSSRVRLARNLAGAAFTSRADVKASSALLDRAFEAGRKTRTLGKAAYVKLDALDPLERIFLMERRLISRELAERHKHGGVIVGDLEILSVMINEEDHLRLQGIDSGLCLAELWTKTAGLEEELGRSLAFAYDEEWGYLTACPTNAGTGLRVSALLHLPGLALVDRLNAILGGLAGMGMTARGLYGEGTRVLGDFYQISNAASLGRSEQQILADVDRGVRSLVAREIEARKDAVRGATAMLRLEDLTHRSLGILAQARSISFEETMQHLSRLRMALSLEWKLPVDFETLNALMVLAQPGHVQMQAGKPLDAVERDALRATLIRRKIKAA